MTIRKATVHDLDGIEAIYSAIHDFEERGERTTGWIRGVYPTRATAEQALKRGDLFVLEDAGTLYGTGIINNIQVDAYKLGNWQHAANDSEVCVLHTLVIDPKSAGHGYGRALLAFYENYAKEHGCNELRIDTNARNLAARAMYKKHGYTEIGIVPTEFNGIPDVQLVLMEKFIG